MSRKSHAHREPKAKAKAKAQARKRGARRRRPKPSAKRGWRTAATSDKYELYELSVQEPEAECDLIDQVWKEKRARRCRSIREDFCGTAAVCMEWVKWRLGNTAVGVDLDSTVLEWARKRIPQRLKPAQRERLTLLQQDVRAARVRGVDSVLAMNFSYFLFKTRAALRAYFKSVRKSLVKDGIFLLDAYGGSESFEEMEEERDLDGFTYVWDQHFYNPITGDVINHIHFDFPDGTRMKRAFSYDWRLWTLPEIRELLLEAGFRAALVYWEGTNHRTGDGNGIWKESLRGEACQGWIAYFAALK